MKRPLILLSIVSSMAALFTIQLVNGQSCGSTLSSTSGVIESPGFSMGNPYTSKCSWQIEASVRSVVELTIEYFDLAVSESCADDSLTVYDGLESPSNVLLKPSCGLAIPWPAHPNTLLSTGRTITLVFTTNSANSLSTFRASYKQVVPREEYFFAVDANNRIIYKQNRFGVNSEEIPFSGLSRPVAVDYDPIEQKVYITDVGRTMVSRINLDGSGQEEIASVIVAVPDGLAVDPVSRVVYWTDVGSEVTGAIINVARLDGSFRRILVNTNIDSPRDIVVKPYQGHVYWSDWGFGKIERMNGDGTDRTEVINSGLGWPNGIAIDMAGGKLYWADAQLNKIERSNLDGSARELLKTFGDDVHPFGLIFVDNALFWTDWVTEGIDVADSNLQNDPSTLLVAGIPTRFHGLAFHSTDDPAIVVNDCSFQGSNGGCEELCLPVPSGTSCVAVSPTFNNCPADKVIVTKDVQFVSWIPPTVDNPSGTQVTISASRPQSSLYISPSDGTIQVTYTAIDELGHSARSCVFNITALYDDEIAPEVYGCPGDITREVSPEIGFTFVIWEEPTAIDRVGEVTLTYQSHDVGDVFAVGETLVTYTWEDNSGNTADCEFLVTVTVADRVPPDVEGCPNDIFVEVPAGVVSTNVNWDEPRAEDDIGEVTMTYQSHSSRDAFLVGTTTVIYTWEDTAGNYAECRFYVTVTVEPQEEAGIPTALVGAGIGALICLIFGIVILVICKCVTCHCKPNSRNRSNSVFGRRHATAPEASKVWSVSDQYGNNQRSQPPKYATSALNSAYEPSPQSPPPTYATAITNSAYLEIEDTNHYTRDLPLTNRTSVRPPSLPARDHLTRKNPYVS